MTTMTAACLPARITRTEKMLLRMAAAATRYVSARAARRTAAPHRRLLMAQAQSDMARRIAEGYGATGMLPR